MGLINRLNLEDLLKAIITRAETLVGTPHGFIYLVEPDGTEMVTRVNVGLFSNLITDRLKPGEGLSGKIWQTGRLLAVEDYRTWSGRLSGSSLDVFCAMAGVPLKSGSQVIGVIGLAYLEEGQTFGDEEITILSRFAELASIALDNVRLYMAAQQELVERRRVEEALCKNEARYRAIVEDQIELICRWLPVNGRYKNFKIEQGSKPNLIRLPQLWRILF